MEELIDDLRTILGVADKTILALLREYGNLDSFYAPKCRAVSSFQKIVRIFQGIILLIFRKDKRITAKEGSRQAA